MPRMASHTTVNIPKQQRLQALLAQQQFIQDEITSLRNGSPLPLQHHRSPIHKQQYRRSNVPRSLSSNGASMGRHLSSDRMEATSRSRTLSQESAPGMTRTASKGSNSGRTLPFTQTGPMPPPLQLDSQRDNHTMLESWDQDGPYNPYTFSSQRKPDLQGVPEVGENPADFLLRNGMFGGPSPPAMPLNMSNPSVCQASRHRLSTSSQPYNLQIPDTPTTTSLTDATTHVTMSRQNSLCNEPLLESIQMMKFNSQTSFSTDIFNGDENLYYHATPYKSPCHSRHSDEEQSQLLIGAGGASQNSQISQSLHPSESYPLFPFSASFGGEKMEHSQSSESSSTSSSKSRNKQRLQVSNQAAARPLMPKGGSDDNVMSRDNSSQSMTRLESRDGTQDKIAISKPTYQRPKHERVYCKECEEHPEGFRGEHELRRHCDRQHKSMVKKWVCIEPTMGSHHPKPVLPLSRCKSCAVQKKKYGAYYNAAAHLRRAHFKPKAKGRSKSNKVEEAQKRGGKGGGDWPSMQELKHWMKEVEEAAPEYQLSTTQEEAADESDDEEIEDNFDEQLSATNNSTSDAFDVDVSAFLADPPSFDNFPSPLQFSNNMSSADLSPIPSLQQPLHHTIDLSSMNTFNPSHHQTSIDPSFNQAFVNDPSMAAFLDPSSIPQTFNDGQSLVGLNFVDPLNYI